MAKQDILKSPANKKLTIGLIVVGIIWMAIGVALNLMVPTTGVFAFFVMLFDLCSGGILFWLIDQEERSNKLVKNWLLIAFFIAWIGLVMTAPIKPMLIIL